jgi:hypothetical protein
MTKARSGLRSRCQSIAHDQWPATDIAGSKFRLRLTGGAIISDSTCGTDTVRVYLATLWEGNGRECGDTPEYVRPEVQPVFCP